MDKFKRHVMWWGAGTLVVVAAIAWWMLRPAGIPEGFAASNGRIEATEVDIATKIAGRIDTILVSEGQFVRQAGSDRANQRGRKRGGGGASAAGTAAK